MSAPQQFSLDVAGRRHEVDVVQHAVRRTVTWSVDGAPVATKTTSDDAFSVRPDHDAAVGRLELRFTTLGRPRRATWHPVDDALGREGLDLDPAPGSPAAAYAERLAAHPTRYTLVQTGLGVLKVLVPILMGVFAYRFVVDLPWPTIPWPDLPSIDLPSIPWPSIPWPDLPAIPWPDWHLPDWHAPAWVGWLLDHVKLVWPVVLAFVLARGELRRRRQQEARKAAARTGRPGASASSESPEDQAEE